MSRTNIYNCLKQYEFLKPDISMFNDIEIEIDPISKDMHLIYYFIERHNITGDLKQYLLNYEKNKEII